jgi:hypothetical protein
MVLEIKKNTSSQEVKLILRKSRKRRAKKNISAFFGKLPSIGDGLKYQKKLRNEWK